MEKITWRTQRKYFQEFNIIYSNSAIAFEMAWRRVSGSSNFSVDPVFAAFHAYPGIWLQDGDDSYVYGSLTEETRQALEYLHGWYERQFYIENQHPRNLL